MSAAVEKRRNFLINILFIAAILGLIFVFFKYLFWLAAPFLLSFFFAVLLQRPLRLIDKKTKGKGHAFFSILLVVLSICIIIIPLIFLLSAIFSEIGEFARYLVEQLNDLPAFLATLENEILDLLKFLPDNIYSHISETITETFSNLINGSGKISTGDINMDTIKSGLSTGISGVYSVVRSIPSVLIGLVIGIIAWIFFTKDYNYIVAFIQKQLPEGKQNILVEIKQVFSKTVLKMVKAYGIILLITFLELSLGFSILKVTGILDNSYYLLIALCIAIFDILPVAGSGGILIPWALISLVLGNYKLAIALMVIYAAITVIRQYIEPKIVGNSLGVHPIITLMGLYFGLKIFGFLGMFIVPLTVMTLKAFNDAGRIHIWKTVERN